VRNWLNLFIAYHNKELKPVKWTEPSKVCIWRKYDFITLATGQRNSGLKNEYSQKCHLLFVESDLDNYPY